MFALFLEFRARTGPQHLWPFFSETGLKFFIWTQSQIGPCKRASPFNQAHVKREAVALSRKLLRRHLIS